MEKYQNEENLIKDIMEQSRHLFVYGENCEYRSAFLKKIEDIYALSDSSKPAAIYLDDFGIPEVDSCLTDKNKDLILSMSRELLSFSIASTILSKTLDSNLEDRLKKLLNVMNKYKNNSCMEIKSIKDLLIELKISRDFYYENCMKYINGSIKSINIDSVVIPFLPLERFVRQTKDDLELDSYFGIILDSKYPLSKTSMSVVNDLISSRINKDISVKVIVEPGTWKTYMNTNGQYIEDIHDYSSIELDDSYKKYIKKENKC